MTASKAKDVHESTLSDQSPLVAAAPAPGAVVMIVAAPFDGLLILKSIDTRVNVVHTHGWSMSNGE